MARESGPQPMTIAPRGRSNPNDPHVVGLASDDVEKLASTVPEDAVAYLVSRDIWDWNWLPNALMPDHQFVAIVDPKSGRLIRNYSYGSGLSGAGRTLRPEPQEGAGRDDVRAWNSPSHWGVRKQPIPAPARAVAAAGEALNRQLGTAAVPYHLNPALTGGANSNSAAATVALRALRQRDSYAAPTATIPQPPTGAFAPGSSTVIGPSGDRLQRTPRGWTRQLW